MFPPGFKMPRYEGGKIDDAWKAIANLVRLGRVAQVDYDQARARVQVGEVLTAWLPWTTTCAGNDVSWSPVEIGEQVIILAPSGNLANGIITHRLYSQASPANGDRASLRRISFGDGTVVEYDREIHRFSLTLPDDSAEVRIIAAGKVTVAADGDVAVEAGGNATFEAQGTVIIKGNAIRLDGPVTQTGGDMTSDGISAQHHTHGGVQGGSSNTGQPQ